MNRPFTVLCLLVSTLGFNAGAQTSSAPSASASAAPAGPTKIAIIAFQPAVASTNEGQRDFGELRKKFEPKNAALKRQADELDVLKKDMQTKSDTLSDTARAAQLKSIDDKEKALQRSGEDAQNEYQSEAGELYSKLAQKVFDVVQTYASQQGYTLVMDITPTQQGVQPILWAAESTNITKPVVDAYNTKSGVPAPPSSGAASSAPATRPSTTPRAPSSTAKPPAK